MANKVLAEACVALAEEVATAVGESGRDSALTDQLLWSAGRMSYRAICGARGEAKAWREAAHAADEMLYWLKLCEKGRMLPAAVLVRLEKHGRPLKRKLNAAARTALQTNEVTVEKRDATVS